MNAPEKGSKEKKEGGRDCWSAIRLVLLMQPWEVSQRDSEVPDPAFLRGLRIRNLKEENVSSKGPADISKAGRQKSCEERGAHVKAFWKEKEASRGTK